MRNAKGSRLKRRRGRDRPWQTKQPSEGIRKRPSERSMSESRKSVGRPLRKSQGASRKRLSRRKKKKSGKSASKMNVNSRNLQRNEPKGKLNKNSKLSRNG